MMLPIDQLAGTVRSRKDFVAFVRSLHTELTERPTEWPNSELPAFLEALAAWAEDMDGYFRNRGEPLPDPPGWKTFAAILSAARLYE